jgi:hypothetical protein
MYRASTIVVMTLAVCVAVHAVPQVAVDAGAGLKGYRIDGPTVQTVGEGLSLSFPKKSAKAGSAGGSIVADAGTAGGALVGDYAAAGVKGLSFRLKCNTGDLAKPPIAAVIFRTASNPDVEWRKYIEPSTTEGEWSTYVISLDMGGWTSQFGTNLPEDLREVSRIGISFAQSGEEAKSYSIDRFMLLDDELFRALNYFSKSLVEISDEDKNADDDGDGMSNWIELQTGTSASDSTSVFAAEIQNPSGKVKGMVLRWPCASGAAYTLQKAEGLTFEFSAIMSGRTATPDELQEGYIEYEDKDATGDGPYFYRIIKE